VTPMAFVVIFDSFSSGLQPGLQRVHALQLGDSLGRGNFGEVFACERIHGAPSASPMVVKIFRDNGLGSEKKGIQTIRRLQEKIIETNQKRMADGRPELQSLPALRALPQFSFSGEMDGRQVNGYAANRLDLAGYVPLSTLREEEEQIDRYAAIGMEDRLQIATELAEGLQALTDEMSFIHADLNPPNVLVNVEECHLAIIDFDSGSVMEGQHEPPTTVGKRGQWLAPEIAEELEAQAANCIVKVSRLTDAWAACVGIHDLLFMLDPLFFLRTATRPTVETYLAKYEWPAIAFEDSLAARVYEPAYWPYREQLDALPEPLIGKLKAAINPGFLQPNLRPSFQQWGMVLRAAQRPPQIETFVADPESIVAGMRTRLSWRVHGERAVSIDNGIGPVEPQGSIEILPAEDQRDQRYTLTVCGRNGDSISRSLVVRVWPVPVLRWLAVPTCRIDQRIVLRALPTFPEINLPIRLDLSVRAGESPSPTTAGARVAEARARLPTGLPRGPAFRGAWLNDLFQQLRNELNSLTGDR
jgi:serine/threonine protein kinase